MTPAEKGKMRDGFTLVELLVVIAIIGILAALLFPALSVAKAKVTKTVCLSRLRQLNVAIQMYCDDFQGHTPVDMDARRSAHDLGEYGIASYFSYREMIKSYIGLKGETSSQDKPFICPADTFYYRVTSLPLLGLAYKPTPAHEEDFSHYSSYAFNGGITNIFSVYTNNLGVGDQKLSSVKEPARTVLNMELPSMFPFSWHDPGNPTLFGAVTFNNGAVLFDDAKNTLGFVDGHARFTRIFWNPTPVQPGAWPLAVQYDPPPGYDYRWSGN